MKPDYICVSCSIQLGVLSFSFLEDGMSRPGSNNEITEPSLRIFWFGRGRIYAGVSALSRSFGCWPVIRESGIASVYTLASPLMLGVATSTTTWAGRISWSHPSQQLAPEAAIKSTSSTSRSSDLVHFILMAKLSSMKKTAIWPGSWRALTCRAHCTLVCIIVSSTSESAYKTHRNQCPLP
jgi:hypothetical protein